MSEFKIKDGSGSGRLATVDDNFRLETNSVTQSVEHFNNYTFKKAFSAVIQQTPSGANDCFFYVKNTGAEPIVVESIDYRVASAETVLVYLNDTGTASGTDYEPANLNTSGSIQLSSNSTILVGNDITGLTQGDLAYRLFLTSTETNNFNFDQDIILEQGGVFSLYAGTGGIQIDMNINLYRTAI